MQCLRGLQMPDGVIAQTRSAKPEAQSVADLLAEGTGPWASSQLIWMDCEPMPDRSQCIEA